MIFLTNEKINLHTGQSFHDYEDLMKLTIEKKKTRNVNISANFMLPCFFHSATHYRFSMHCHSNTSPPLLPNIYICKRTKINCGTNTFSSETIANKLYSLLEWTKMNIGKITNSFFVKALL